MNFGSAATLTFTSNSLSNVSAGSTVSLGSFGFSLFNPGLSVYSGSFDLTVDFSNPLGASGSPLQASVLGGVLFNAGGALITFNSGSQVFNYNGGSFTLDLSNNPIVITNQNQTVNIKATLATNPIVTVPEGSSLAMLGVSGFVLLAAFLKKLRPSANAC